MIPFILTIFASLSFASPPLGKTMINQDVDDSKNEVKVVKSSADTKGYKINKPSAESHVQSASNLPLEYNRKLSVLTVGENAMYVSKLEAKLNGMKAGTIVWAVLDQELIISQSVPNPVRAVIVSGPFAGNYILGEAVFDKDLHRALINFSKILLKDSQVTYQFKGQALSLRGSVGLEGEYFNQSAKFVLAEFTSAAVAGYLDSGISRSQTNQGNYVTEPSASNAAKSGAVTALSKSTDRFAEAARATSDYVKTSPFTEIQVIINEDASLL